MRCAISSASSVPLSSSQRTTNSSPPKRATVSPGPDLVGQPVGEVDEQLVAGAVAEAVVDDLEVVEVEEEHRQLGCGCGATRAIAISSRSSSSIRFGSPVSGSCVAWCCRRASSALRSDMSRAVIGHHLQVAGRVAVAEHDCRDGDDLARTVPYGRLALPGHAALEAREDPAVPELDVLVGEDVGDRRAPDRVGIGDLEERASGLVQVGDRPLRNEEHDEVGGRLEDRGEANAPRSAPRGSR